MHVGALIFPTDLSIHPARLARELEERGYESLWVTEHTHIPTSRRTPWPGGADLPDEYRRTLDPFVALSLAAGVTERLKLATGICLVNQHHPITLAKTVASLDHASAGRVALGIGVGWNVDEMEHHGVDPARRRAHGRETVLAMRALWTHEAAEYHGEIVDFSPSWSWPKPAQAGGPPVLMGGAGGPVTFRHVAEYCDGWMPIHGRRGVFEKLPELRAAWEAAGRASACSAARRGSTSSSRTATPASHASCSACRRHRRTWCCRCSTATPTCWRRPPLSDQPSKLTRIAAFTITIASSP
jgi:probable F420-dependent oxidoreductase